MVKKRILNSVMMLFCSFLVALWFCGNYFGGISHVYAVDDSTTGITKDTRFGYSDPLNPRYVDGENYYMLYVGGYSLAGSGIIPTADAVWATTLKSDGTSSEPTFLVDGFSTSDVGKKAYDIFRSDNVDRMIYTSFGVWWTQGNARLYRDFTPKKSDVVVETDANGSKFYNNVYSDLSSLVEAFADVPTSIDASVLNNKDVKAVAGVSVEQMRAVLFIPFVADNPARFALSSRIFNLGEMAFMNVVNARISTHSLAYLGRGRGRGYDVSWLYSKERASDLIKRYNDYEGDYYDKDHDDYFIELSSGMVTLSFIYEANWDIFSSLNNVKTFKSTNLGGFASGSVLLFLLGLDWLSVNIGFSPVVVANVVPGVGVSTGKDDRTYNYYQKLLNANKAHNGAGFINVDVLVDLDIASGAVSLDAGVGFDFGLGARGHTRNLTSGLQNADSLYLSRYQTEMYSGRVLGTAGIVVPEKVKVDLPGTLSHGSEGNAIPDIVSNQHIDRSKSVTDFFYLVYRFQSDCSEKETWYISSLTSSTTLATFNSENRYRVLEGNVSPIDYSEIRGENNAYVMRVVKHCVSVVKMNKRFAVSNVPDVHFQVRVFSLLSVDLSILRPSFSGTWFIFPVAGSYIFSRYMAISEFDKNFKLKDDRIYATSSADAELYAQRVGSYRMTEGFNQHSFHISTFAGFSHLYAGLKGVDLRITWGAKVHTKAILAHEMKIAGYPPIHDGSSDIVVLKDNRSRNTAIIIDSKGSVDMPLKIPSYFGVGFSGHFQLAATSLCGTYKGILWVAGRLGSNSMLFFRVSFMIFR